MSEAPLLLALDLGTSNCKAAAFEADGRELVRVEVPYPTYAPSPGAYEQRPADWLDAAAEALRGAADRLAGEAGRVVGLALSAWGPGLVLLSPSGEPLNEFSPTWQDTRSRAHGERLLAEVGADWIGGGLPLTGFAAKLAWARDEWPELAARAEWALGVKDYLLHWLTGSIATEPSSGPYGERWPADALAAAGWSEARLPPLLPVTEVGGSLLPERAFALGLQAGLPVVMGLNDGASATIGVGCHRAGDGVVSLGTNGVLRLLLDRMPPTDVCLTRSLFRYPLVEGLWVTGGFALSGGNSLRWLVEAIDPDGGERLYEAALAEAARVPAGSDGVLFLPYLVGRGSPFPDAEAAGAFLGLRLGHGRGHLVRAVLEGVAYGLRDISGAFAELGWRIERLMVTGGGARSPLWRSIIAAVFGEPVHYAVGDSNLGAAIVLAVALGVHGSFDEAVERMISASSLAPPAAEVEAYEAGYAAFRAGAAALVPTEA